MKKGFTVILLTVFLLYRITFPTSVVHAEEVEISAPSGILMEMSTERFYLKKMQILHGHRQVLQRS